MRLSPESARCQGCADSALHWSREEPGNPQVDSGNKEGNGREAASERRKGRDKPLRWSCHGALLLNRVPRPGRCLVLRFMSRPCQG